MAKTPKKNGRAAQRGAVRVAFLARIEAIRDELEAGWPMKTVWRKLADKELAGMSYTQFRVYVHRYIKGDYPLPGTSGGKSAGKASHGTPARPSPGGGGTPQRDFEHNPHNTDDDDLI